MQIHKRVPLVKQATQEFRGFAINWMTKHDLTYGEVLGILADEIALHAKNMRLCERHPKNPRDKGSEEA